MADRKSFGHLSTRKSSTAWPTPAERWTFGATTITMTGRIHRWATKRPQKHSRRPNNLTATRPACLLNPKPITINSKDSRIERGAGHHD
jgi:hypothetical protein